MLLLIWSYKYRFGGLILVCRLASRGNVWFYTSRAGLIISNADFTLMCWDWALNQPNWRLIFIILDQYYLLYIVRIWVKRIRWNVHRVICATFFLVLWTEFEKSFAYINCECDVFLLVIRLSWFLLAWTFLTFLICFQYRWHIWHLFLFLISLDCLPR